MINVKFFGNYSIIAGTNQLSIAAKTIKNLCYLIELETGIETKRLKNSMMFLNGKPVLKNKKLKAGDEVAFFSPASGG